MTEALAFAVKFLSGLPALLTAGEGAYEAVKATAAEVQAMASANRAPTDAEWDALHSRLNADVAELES